MWPIYLSTYITDKWNAQKTDYIQANLNVAEIFIYFVRFFFRYNNKYSKYSELPSGSCAQMINYFHWGNYELKTCCFTHHIMIYLREHENSLCASIHRPPLLGNKTPNNAALFLWRTSHLKYAWKQDKVATGYLF